MMSCKMIFASVVLAVAFTSLPLSAAPPSQVALADDVLLYAVRQYTRLSQTLTGKDTYIHTGNPLSNEWDYVDQGWWTAGFYGGSLWMLYKLTGDAYWKTLATEYQERIKSWQFNTGNHDIGFVIMSTFGLALEYDESLTETQRKEYEQVLHQAATSFATRYSRNLITCIYSNLEIWSIQRKTVTGNIFLNLAVVRCTRSWNNANEFTVIIDNMMNLELLYRAFEITGNTTFRDIAHNHSDRTIEEHFRENGGTYHVIGYNEKTGVAERKYNAQGYADESTWSRGLAWATHGYTTMYEKSGLQRYLDIAERSAKYFSDHLNDRDFVAFWDFDAPRENGQYQPRDTSATAIAAHAFLKLYKITENLSYIIRAEEMLKDLEDYRADAKPEYQIPAILVNGTVFFNQGNFDTSLVYADFYFLRAHDLYQSLIGNLAGKV